ncbi:MAG: DUF373 family protein [Candidatus Anstonellaceae archaeon]
MLKKSKLILCIDRDNDIYEKASISGPIIGREENLNAAISLALVDPTDVDSNAIFRAVSLYDKLKKENLDVEVVTLTGSSKLGYVADEEIAKQLDSILAQKKFDSCILVSDGVSDQSSVTIIQSRIKIDAVDIVVVKQAQELEKTYFVILEKLKEPYYARLIFGVPALLGIIFVLSRVLNWGIEIPIFLISIYLLLRGFGIEEKILKYLGDFSFSVDKISLILYIPSFLFIFISIWAAYNSANEFFRDSQNITLALASGIRSFLTLFPWAIILLITGKVVDLVKENKKVEIIRYSTYAVFTVLGWLVFISGVSWLLNDVPPYVDFEGLLFIILLSSALGFFSHEFLNKLRKELFSKLKVAGKEVISLNGNYVGKVLGIEPNLEALAIKTFFGEKILIPISAVEQIDQNKIIVSMK